MNVKGVIKFISHGDVKEKMEGARAFSFGVLVLFFRKGNSPRSALLPSHLPELAHVSTLNKLLAKETKS